MKTYSVYVDDNFHSGDESERYKLGEYPTREEALAACRQKVDEYFARLRKGEHSFRDLWQGYMMYGEDPFIINDDAGERFSAWEYAKERCAEYSA